MKAVGKIINNRYQIKSLLGEGGMGMVYCCEDITIDQRPLLALKMLREFDPKEGKLLDWLKNEFRTLAALHHPYLAQVFDFGKDSESGRSFYTAQYITGKDIFTATRSLENQKVLEILILVCEGLEYIHSRNILHNDIKPANILVQEASLEPKILDFGLSVLTGAHEPLTQGKITGTLAYLAPEIIQGEAASVRSDLFALGMIFYKILAGRRPQEDLRGAELLQANLTAAFPSPRTFNPHIPPQLESLILELLAKHASERPHSAREVANRVLRLAGNRPHGLPADFAVSLTQIQKPIGKERALHSLKKFAQQKIRKTAQVSEGTSHAESETTSITFSTLENPLVLEKTGPSFALVTGDAGSGKSFLLQTIKRDYQLRDIAFLIADCSRKSGPFAPWLGMFSQVLGLLPKTSKIFQRFAERTAFLEKGWEEDFDPSAKGNFQNQADFFFQLSELLAGAFEEIPFVLAFDHLEALDSASQGFFHHLAMIEKLPLGPTLPPVIISARNAAPLEDFLEGKQLLSIPLPPLTAIQCQEFLNETFFPQTVNADLAVRIHEVSSGVPRFIQEILRDLLESKTLTRTAAHWNLDRISVKTVSLAPSLEELLNRRIEQLPKQQRQLLSWLTVWGESLSTALLEQLLEKSFGEFEQDLNALVAQDIVTGDEIKGWWFSQIAYLEMVSIQEKSDKDLHRKCIRVLEALDPKPWTKLAKHYQHVQQVKAAIYAALKAAEQASRLFAYEEALDFYQMAVQQAKSSGAPCKEEVLALDGSAGILWLLGRRDETLKTYQELLDHPLSNLFSDLRIKAYRTFGVTHRDRGEHAEAIAHFEMATRENKALASLQGGEVMTQIALVFQRMGKPKESRAWKERARELLSQHSKKPFEAAGVLTMLAYLANQEGNATEAKSLYEEALQIFERHLDKSGSAAALSNLGTICAKQGAYPKAEKLLREALEKYSEVGDASGRANCLFFLGNLAYLRGSFREANQLFLQAFPLAQRMENLHLVAKLETSLGQLEVDRGNLAAARTYLQSARKHRKSLGDRKGLIHIGLGLQALYLALGNFEQTRKWIERTQEACEEDEDKTSCQLNLAALSLRTREYSLTRKALQEAIPWLASSSPETKILYALTQSELHFHEQQYDQALKALEAAQVSLQEIFSQELQIRYRTQRFRVQLALLDDKSKKSLSALQNEIGILCEEIRDRDHHWLKWNIACLAGEVLEKRQDLRRSLEAYREAHGEIMRVAEHLPLHWRKVFLADPEKQCIFSAVERLSQSQSLLKDGYQSAQEKIKNLSRILEINRHLMQVWQTKEGLLNFILETSLDLLQAKRGFIVLRNEEEIELTCAKNLSSDANWNPVNEFSRSLVQEVVQSSQPRLVLNAEQDPTWNEKQSVAQLHLKSIVCVPMKFRQNVLGVLYLDHNEIAGRFSADHLEILSRLADQAALTLEIFASFRQLQETTETISQELIRSQSLLQEQSRALAHRYRYDRIVGGKDPAMQKVFSLLDRIIPTNSSVLVEGESGTGKELIAQAIHHNGPRKDKPFIAINCSGLNAQLLESELFGHMKGSFTGATDNKKGLFWLANSGSLFLDEIANMPLDLQPKLLRVLQEGEIWPVGANKPQTIDVRVISASNQPLQTLLEEGKFREDLYYRLNVITLFLPPLRERQQDLDLLIDTFVKEVSRNLDQKPKAFTQKAREALHAYPWPGNVRELRHSLEQILTLCEDRMIRFKHLPESIRKREAPEPKSFPHLEKSRELFHRDYFQRVMQRSKGNITLAAEIAGIRRETLSRFLKQYRIRRKSTDFK